MRIKVCFFNIFLIVLLFFGGCGYIPLQMPDFPQRAETDSPRDRSEESAGQSRSTGSESSDVSRKRTIERHLEQGDVLAALEGVGENVRQGACDKSVSQAYIRAVNRTIREGRARLARDLPAEAGPLFRSARQNFPQNQNLASRVVLTPVQLEAAIDRCAQQLMEEGLSAYRQERLEDAIEIWEKILVFDPMHRAGRSAIETAERQLANLKKIGTGPVQEYR